MLTKGGTIRRRMGLVFAAGMTAVHALASLFYERIMFSWDLLLDRTRPDHLTLLLAFVCAKLIGVLLLFGLWSAVWALVQRRIPKRALLAFAVLAVPCIYIVAVRWFALYGYEADNAISFYHAIRYEPYVWHHIFTSSAFGGAYMLFPHPAALPLVQSLLFCAVLAYCFWRASQSLGTRLGWGVLWLVLLPESFLVAFNPYRNDMYAILCLWLCAVLLFDWLDGKQRSLWFSLVLAAAFALAGAWRSEGIIYLALFVLALLPLIKRAPRRFAALLCALLAFFIVLRLPQQQAQRTDPTSAQDYAILNYMNPLQFILNQKNANLRYEGAEADLAALDAITPLPLIEEFGINGFRLTNDAAGRDMHAADAAPAQYAAFTSAYRRIVLHNPLLYLKCQANAFFRAAGAPFNFAHDGYSGTPSGLGAEDCLTTYYATRDIGNAELLAHERWPIDAATPAGAAHVTLSEQINTLQYRYAKLVAPLTWIRRILLPFVCAALGLWAAVRKRKLFPALFALVLLAEWAGLILLSPEGRAAYYYPLNLMMALFCLCMAGVLLRRTGTHAEVSTKKETM